MPGEALATATCIGERERHLNPSEPPESDEILELRAELVRFGNAIQASALPPALPQISGLDLAGYYRPARGVLTICGDFYDAFSTQAGTGILAVGDVCGIGVDASVVMVSVRHRLRALAETGKQPGQILSLLSDSLLREGPEKRFCTLCYLEVRPGPGRAHITMSSGGHPLPLVRRADGTVATIGSPGFLLGVRPDVEHLDTEVDLVSGDLLLLYTDGIVELRGADASEGELALQSALVSCSHADAASALAAIVRDMPRPAESRQDDSTMLLLRVS